MNQMQKIQHIWLNLKRTAKMAIGLIFLAKNVAIVTGTVSTKISVKISVCVKWFLWSAPFEFLALQIFLIKYLCEPLFRILIWKYIGFWMMMNPNKIDDYYLRRWLEFNFRIQLLGSFDVQFCLKLMQSHSAAHFRLNFFTVAAGLHCRYLFRHR